MQAYWKMNRLGFINFWKFKKEEFYFSNGCALIRGHNGSGKSIVIQSAVTFLLDGSTRKLDPSGSSAREMSFYLIGDRKQDATGYVFLEFKKGSEYAAIGIGLRARRNKGVDFWGFGLNDGRRLEKDISLYKDGIPLNKQECRTLIGSSKENFFTDRKKEYETEVNQMLFGLSPYRYRELISLLSEIRKPIAGADRQAGLKFIYDKLNSSLSTLQEEDFEALVSSMEMMDEYNEKLQIMKEEYDRIASIHKRYKEYMDSQTYKKYLCFQKESAKTGTAKKQWESAVKDYEEICEKRKKAYIDLNSAEIDLSEYDLMDDYTDIENRNTRLRILEDNHSETKQKRMDAQSRMEQYEYDLQKSSEKLSSIKEALHDYSLEFTWTPDLAESLQSLVSLYMELESMPKPGMDLNEFTKDLFFYIDRCELYDLRTHKEAITDILKETSLSPEDKIRGLKKIFFSTFLKTNNHFVERNAYVKYQSIENSMENAQTEVHENNRKLEILFSEFLSLPSLSYLILLNPETEKKRDEIWKKISGMENSSLFEKKSSAREYRELLDAVNDYHVLIEKRKSEESRMEKIKELLAHFSSLKEEYEDKELEIQGEINLLSRTVDDSYRDIYELRETVIRLKAMIQNLDAYVIPERKKSMDEKEEAYIKQKEISDSFASYKDIDPELLKKYRDRGQGYEEHLLIEEFMKQKMDLHRYCPLLKRTEEDFYILSFTVKGRDCSIDQLLSFLKSEIEEKNSLLSQEENQIYEKVLMDCLVEKINHQINSSKEWIRRIRENMLSLETTSGMVFGIKWVQVKHIDDFATYFRQCMENYREQSDDLNYMECIMECLDYRNWFEFKLEMNGSILSNKRFLTLSGGERATAIYSTLLSALTSMFNECKKEDHPRLFALDEAFTVVDGENIESVFAFIGSVGLDYLINSQTLWGTYPTVPSLSISNLTNLKGNQNVIVHRFLWKNNRKIPQFTSK